jgi:2Fe-2S ferredoxin
MGLPFKEIQRKMFLMPLISFNKGYGPIFCEVHDNLMATLRGNQVPVASSCQGDGVCGKCRIQILAGAEKLSPPNATEQFLRQRYRLAPNERISCQTQVLGDILIDTTYW